MNDREYLFSLADSHNLYGYFSPLCLTINDDLDECYEEVVSLDGGSKTKLNRSRARENYYLLGESQWAGTKKKIIPFNCLRSYLKDMAILRPIDQSMLNESISLLNDSYQETLEIVLQARICLKQVQRSICSPRRWLAYKYIDCSNDGIYGQYNNSRPLFRKYINECNELFSQIMDTLEQIEEKGGRNVHKDIISVYEKRYKIIKTLSRIPLFSFVVEAMSQSFIGYADELKDLNSRYTKLDRILNPSDHMSQVPYGGNSDVPISVLLNKSEHDNTESELILQTIARIKHIKSALCMTEDEIFDYRHQLFELSRKRNDEQERIVKTCQQLIVRTANKYLHLGVEYLDLIQEGNAALVGALNTYLINDNYEFIEYAGMKINESMQKALIDVNDQNIDDDFVRSIRYHEAYSAGDLHFHVSQLKEDMSAELSSRPYQLYTFPTTPVSLFDTEIWLDRSADVLSDNSSVSPDSLAMKRILFKAVDRLLCALSKKEEMVVRLRFGIDDGLMRTYEQVGEIFGITRERARQIEANAFHKLSHPERIIPINNYLRLLDFPYFRDFTSYLIKSQRL